MERKAPPINLQQPANGIDPYRGDVFPVVAPLQVVNDDHVGNERLFAEYFVHEHSQVVGLMVVDAYKDDSVVTQQLSSQEQPRIHQREPC